MGDYNVTVADFAGKNRICMTDTLYQYDYGQKLQIDNIPALPQTYEAHFSNVQHGGVSITVTGMDGIVDIPNALLMTGKRIYCWIYVTEPGSGETEYQVLMPVQARPMPEYYDVTDTGAFDSVVQQVGEYAATATAGATNATASAAAAATSASEAAASASAAETAKNAAETAQAAAETAAQTATEKAQQSAQNASQAASDAGRAESAAGRAETAETGAESAKTDAETAAQGAADSASAASASATSAGQAAASADQSATAAAQSAASIDGDVQIASQKAAEAEAAAGQAVAAKDAAVTAQTAAETAETNAGQSASTATTKAAEAAQSASGAAQSKTDAEAAATRAEQAAATLTVDSALSDTSVNPVQNKVITGEVTQLKSQLNNNFEFGSFKKTSSIFTAKPQYNASSAGWVSNTGYNSWYFLTDKDTEIYADSTAVSAMHYFSIAVYNGEVSSANYVNRYRLSDNNLPTKSAPLVVGTGKTIVVTIEYQDTDFVLYASNAPLLLGNGFMEQVDKNTDESIDTFVNKNFAYGYLAKDSAIFTPKPQYSASSAGWVSNTGYNSWYFEADSDCIIYTEANNLIYYSICIYNGSVSTANYVARYRKSDNNLPTKEVPLSVQSGQTIVVTIQYTDNDFSLFYNLAPVLLGDQMVKQVEDVLGRKTVVEYATNQYVITSNGIAFDLRKTTDATINQDCWRFVSVKKNGTDIVNGDIIGVLIENGETDFMGGVHGDEKVVDFHIRADGKPINDAVTVCNKVTIFMYSHLYRVSSPTTNVIDRYVNITIENGVMTVENTFKCLVDGFVVQYAYNGGLIGIFKNNITYLASNSEIADLSNMPSEWNNSHGSYWYDVLFEDGLLHIENIVGKEQQNYSGRVQYFSSETPQRLKVYMTTDAGATWNAGHICNGKFVCAFG